MVTFVGVDTPQTDATNETSEKNDVDPEGVIQDNSGTDGLSNEESDNVELPTDKQEIDTALDDMQAGRMHIRSSRS